MRTESRTENPCKHMVRDPEGYRIDCIADTLDDCPKHRSRGILTSACWRIREKKAEHKKEE